MHVLVLTERFHPEISAPSVRILGHARHWLREGHRVTVVTGAPNAPHGKVFDGYSNGPWTTETLDGVRVIRLWSYPAANAGFLRRTLDYGSLALSQVLASALYADDVDVVLATSPPLQTAMAGALVARARRWPWVFEVRDLWPASIKAVGAADGPLLDFLERLELSLYRQATRVTLLTRSFERDLVERGIDPAKLDVVPNAGELSHFTSTDADRARIRAGLGVDEDTFVAGYIGTTGMAHGLETVLDAADRTRENADVRWLILGEGAERANLEARAASMGLPNLVFHDFVPHEDIPHWIGAMDASLVHLRPDPLFQTVIPSKTFEIMAMGRPILMGVEGEVAELVDEAGAGICIPSGDAASMAEAVLRLKADPELAQRLGAAGIEAARTVHNRKARARQMMDVLERAVAEHRRR